ncbi:MAG: glycosyltransferase [Proteobacteria bacterium]|nr:glycosyltransferase [Pseudomonadota bacterium]
MESGPCSEALSGSSAARTESAPKLVLHHASNRGKGAAIRTALPSITSPWVLIQDADLEC